MQNLGTPPAEVVIDENLVRKLLASQHPDLASLPIERFAEGWDNALFRVGDRLLARLPRRSASAQLVINEQQYLPVLAPRLPVRIPEPERIGTPSDDYPWPWSIVPSFEGDTANKDIPRDDQAAVVADFLNALHIPAPSEVPCNPYRGIPLAMREAAVAERMRRLKASTQLISAGIESIWRDALSTPIDVEPTWLHGDLHARNVLVDRGRITAIVDWGDLCQGDRATDLAAVWGLFANRDARSAVMSAYRSGTEATWRRARGWAVFFGVTLLDTGLVDNPAHARMGEEILQRILKCP